MLYCGVCPASVGLSQLIFPLLLGSCSLKYLSTYRYKWTTHFSPLKLPCIYRIIRFFFIMWSKLYLHTFERSSGLPCEGIFYFAISSLDFCAWLKLRHMSGSLIMTRFEERLVSSSLWCRQNCEKMGSREHRSHITLWFYWDLPSRSWEFFSINFV